MSEFLIYVQNFKSNLLVSTHVFWGRIYGWFLSPITQHSLILIYLSHPIT